MLSSLAGIAGETDIFQNELLEGNTNDGNYTFEEAETEYEWESSSNGILKMKVKNGERFLECYVKPVVVEGEDAPHYRVVKELIPYREGLGRHHYLSLIPFTAPQLSTMLRIEASGKFTWLRNGHNVHLAKAAVTGVMLFYKQGKDSHFVAHFVNKKGNPVIFTSYSEIDNLLMKCTEVFAGKKY